MFSVGTLGTIFLTLTALCYSHESDGREELSRNAYVVSETMESAVSLESGTLGMLRAVDEFDVAASSDGSVDADDSESEDIDSIPVKMSAGAKRIEKVTLTVVNKTSRDIWFQGDPNWDDQVVIFAPETEKRVLVIPANEKGSGTVRGELYLDPLMMGIGISTGPRDENWFSMSIGVDSGENTVNITEADDDHEFFTFTVVERAPDSVTIELLEHTDG